MGLLDRINKENTESISQDIVDKCLKMIIGNNQDHDRYRGTFINNNLHIDKCESSVILPLKTDGLQDMYNVIKKDFTISTDLNVAIFTDLHDSTLEHVKIKCGTTCQLFGFTGNVELKNINIFSQTLIVDLSNLHLSNVNIHTTHNIQIISGCDMETFKGISGSISTDNLFVYIQKTPLIESIYRGLGVGRSNWSLYEKLVENKFIEILDPDRFDVNTYCITLSKYLSFYITKCPHKFNDPISLNDTWYLAQKSKNPIL